MVKIEEIELEDAINKSLLGSDMTKVWTTEKDEKNFYMAMSPEMIEREKQRLARAELNSANGDTAEIHDQFYRDHKLLLVLFRVLAVMPVTRSSPGTIFIFFWLFCCF